MPYPLREPNALGAIAMSSMSDQQWATPARPDWMFAYRIGLLYIFSLIHFHPLCPSRIVFCSRWRIFRLSVYPSLCLTVISFSIFRYIKIGTTKYNNNRKRTLEIITFLSALHQNNRVFILWALLCACIHVCVCVHCTFTTYSSDERGIAQS